MFIHPQYDPNKVARRVIFAVPSAEQLDTMQTIHNSVAELRCSRTVVCCVESVTAVNMCIAATLAKRYTMKDTPYLCKNVEKVLNSSAGGAATSSFNPRRRSGNFVICTCQLYYIYISCYSWLVDITRRMRRITQQKVFGLCLYNNIPNQRLKICGYLYVAC